ncbi:MAG: hypothetical protein WCH86_05760 [Kiritimatiellales bacterium]
MKQWSASISSTFSRVKKHLDRWKSLYEVLGTLVAVIVSALSLFCSQQAIKQTQQSLALTSKSVEIQQKAFKLRNRPMLSILDYSFTGHNSNRAGETFNHGIKIRLANISEIPANKVSGVVRLESNGSTSRFDPIIPTALCKTESMSLTLGLTDEQFDSISKGINNYVVIFQITYSGMLQEDELEYLSLTSAFYDPKAGAWCLTKQLYK